MTGITLLGVSYKNMAQLFPGFPYPLTTGASNVDLLPLRHLQCEGVPAANTHYSTPHNGYKRCSNIKLSYFCCIKNITDIYNTARKPLLCVNTMYILELTEFTNQYETRYVIYIKNICLDGVPSFSTTHRTVQISTVMLNCALKTVKLWLTDYNY